jgi:hypothetical protein
MGINDRLIMKKILIIILLAVSLTAWGTKYYVDESGNDGTGDGSVGNPWALVSYACTQAITAGDTIYVNAGTYTETEQCIVAPGVSIIGAGATSIINFTYGSTTDYCIKMESASLTNGDQSISYLKLTGSNYTARRGIVVRKRSNVSIHHCTFEDFDREAVNFVYHWSVGYANPTEFSVGNLFYNNILLNCAGYREGEGYGALNINGQDGLLVYNNKFTQTQDAGLNGQPIKGVSGINRNVKIYNNETIQPAFGNGDHWDFAIELWDYRGGIEIYNNKLGGSIDIGGKINTKGASAYAAWIHHNIIEQPIQSLSENTRGFIIEGHLNNEDIIIEHNYVKYTCMGLEYGQPASAEHTIYKNIRISYNIFESIGLNDSKTTNSKGWGVVSHCPGDWQTVDNWQVINNVFTAKQGAYSTMWGIMIPPMVVTNMVIRNNIVVGFDYAGVFGHNNGDIDITCDILSIENNCFYGNGNSNLPRYGEGYTPTNNTTQNNITTDPLFVSTSDLRLQSTSPCRDAGIDVSAITGGLDFLGASLYGAAYDIGAFEYQGTGRVLLIIDDKIATINYKIPLIEH